MSSQRGLASERSLAERLRSIAAYHPSRVALETQDLTFRYADLLAFADEVARAIQGAGGGPGDVIVTPGWRTVDGVAATLAVTLAGAAYMPIDPYQPSAHTATLLRSVRARFAVWPRDAPPCPVNPVIYIDLQRGSIAAIHRTPSTSPASKAIAADSLAYVMFTSGTTGTPKPVGVRSLSVLNLVCGQSYAHFGPDEVVLFGSSPTFDASTFEMWAPLLHGGRIVMAPPQALTGPELRRLVRDQGVTTAWLTAPLFEIFVRSQLDAFVGLRQLLTGGDVVDVISARQFLRAYPSCVLLNGYGPTETTTFALTARITPASLGGEALPIGAPLRGISVDLVSAGRTVPEGTPGELWISGRGVGEYLNGHTQGFCITQKGRTFRTGDWGIRRDGLIEFLGRRDRQVKIRGNRVELDAIELAIRRLAGVEAAAIVAVGDSASQRTLAAFVGSRTTTSVESWQRELARQLPGSQVPSHWHVLPSLPLSPSGKLDRSKLRDIAHEVVSTSTLRAGDGGGAPRIYSGAIEKVLSQLWVDELKVAPPVAADDFFLAGGDSLAAVSLLTAVEQATGKALPMSVLYQGRTFAALVAAAQLPREELWSALVTLRTTEVDNPEQTLFAVHGLNGDLFNMHRLADNLPDDWQIWGLRGLSDVRDSPMSIQSMAQAYTQIVLWTQPKRPTALLGYSAGGIIALAMANILHANHLPVSVILLDVNPPRHWSSAKRVSAQDADGKTSVAADAFAGELPHLGPYTDRRSRFMVNLYAALLAQGPIASPVPVWALRREDASHGDREGESGWGEYLPNFRGTRTLTGDHQSFLRPPLVSQVARTVVSCLSQSPEGA